MHVPPPRATPPDRPAYYRRAPENRPNWLASTAMFRALPTNDSAAMMLHATTMSRHSARSAPAGERARIHMMGGRMKVTGMRPIEEMRPLRGWAGGGGGRRGGLLAQGRSVTALRCIRQSKGSTERTRTERTRTAPCWAAARRQRQQRRETAPAAESGWTHQQHTLQRTQPSTATPNPAHISFPNKGSSSSKCQRHELAQR